MRTRWLLLIALLATGCPGVAPEAHRTTTRADAGTVAAIPPTTPTSPITQQVDGGALLSHDSKPATPKPDTQPAIKPDTQPPVQPCGTVGAACGGAGQAACCADAMCVNYTNVGVKCGKICTGAGDCPENCCIATSTGTKVCAAASFCPAPNPNPNPNPNPSPNSCIYSCGGQAPGGCYCDLGCFFYGDCCPDVTGCL
jgi:hypothetical protein